MTLVNVTKERKGVVVTLLCVVGNLGKTQLFTLVNVLLTLPDSDSDLQSDSNCKRNGYIAIWRSFHTAWSQIQIPILLPTTGMGSESESVP